MSRFITSRPFLLLAAIWAAVEGISLGQLATAEPKASKSGGPAQQQEKIERKGPLAGLPSVPGRHLERIRPLADDTWLNLGAPAPDPKWGRALGRSWSPRMPYAPDLRGAFLAGEGSHGWVNPKTNRQMDDYWFYDINGHRWICIYPGTSTVTVFS
jgi:hypothetical protein